MAIQKRPPHPARGPVILLIILVVLIGAVVLIAHHAHPVAQQPVEVDVARGQPS